MHAGQTADTAGDSIGALLSATWLETIVISTINSLSNSLLALPLGIVGTLAMLDEMVRAKWAGCKSSILGV